MAGDRDASSSTSLDEGLLALPSLSGGLVERLMMAVCVGVDESSETKTMFSFRTHPPIFDTTTEGL